MRLTTFTDYSLRVLIYLAADPERRATIREIAQSFGVSENHLMKVVHFLGTAGILANVRGKGGGLELARAPSRINLGEVVRLTESKLLPAECFDLEHNTCTIVSVCQLRDVLAQAAREFYRVLDRFTLEDVARNRPALSKMFWMQASPRATTPAARTRPPARAPRKRRALA